jgi:hypothetical protein
MLTPRKPWWLPCLALAAACSDGGTHLVTPVNPTPTTFSVTGSDLMVVGNTETFAVAGITGASVAALRWGSDAPAVATVDGLTGQVTAVGAGSATIFADGPSSHGAKLIRTLPNFSGSWNGHYNETGCEASGDLVKLGVCSGSEYDLGTGEMTMTLTQDHASISGEFALNGSPSSDALSGSVATDGTLTFTSTARNQSKLNLDLQNVRFELPETGKMTGSFEQLYSSQTTSQSGTWRVFARLRDMQRRGR